MILRGSKGDNVSSTRSSSSVCPSVWTPGENAGVGRPGGEDGTGEESRLRSGRDFALAFDVARDLRSVDGAGDGPIEAGDCICAISRVQASKHAGFMASCADQWTSRTTHQ